MAHRYRATARWRGSSRVGAEAGAGGTAAGASAVTTAHSGALGASSGVGNRNVIVGVHLAHLAIGEGTPRRQPHHKLDPLGAGLFHQIRNRISRCPLRIVDQAFHEREVEVLVDEARALAVELMRQAAGADHHHPRIGLPGFHGAADYTARRDISHGGDVTKAFWCALTVGLLVRRQHERGYKCFKSSSNSHSSPLKARCNMD